MKKSNLKNLIDGHFLKLYYTNEGCFCSEEIEVIMTKIERQKQQIIDNHVNNVYPIKQLKKGENVTYYTKLNPKNRNHSGKITAKNEEDLKLKIIAYYEGINLNSITFSELVEGLEKQYKANDKEDTGIRHRQIFYQYFPSIIDLQVNKLTSKMVTELLNNLLIRGIKQQGFIMLKLL